VVFSSGIAESVCYDLNRESRARAAIRAMSETDDGR
jgi:hypothetical protein